MNRDLYKKEFLSVLKSIEDTMILKSEEYSTNNNPFHNFEASVGFHKNGTSKKGLWGMLVKHLISIKDFCEDTVSIGQDQLEEKVKDIVIYTILLSLMNKSEIDELDKTEL